MAEGTDMDKAKLEKLISLTFDSNPEVRKKAALELSKVDDPAASLALLELMYDKEKEVAEIARKAIEERKKKEPELVPLTEMFKGVDFSGGKKEKERPTKVIEPLSKMFEKRLGRERFEKIKPKLEEAYAKKGKKAVQEILETYFKAYREIRAENGEVEKVEEVEEITIEEVGSTVGGLEEDLKEIEEMAEIEEIAEEAKEELAKEGLPTSGRELEKSVLALAYEAMLLSEGDEKVAKQTAKAIKDFLSKQVDIAFKIAREKFRRKKITLLPEIKEGMRSIYTEPLEVVDIKEIVWKKRGGKKEVFRRVVVKDKEGNEGVIYLTEGRGEKLAKGMLVKVEGGRAKFFKFSGETAIVLGKRGKLVAEF